MDNNLPSIANEILELEERAQILATGSNLERSLALREVIRQVEEKIKTVHGAMGEDPFPLKHMFTDGAYARQIFLPKGSLTIGKIHRHSHFNFVSIGDVSVLTEDGPQRIQGPSFMISKPGTKRIVYAHQDTLWITIHVTKETDLKKIEDYVIAPTYEALEKVS